MSLMCLLAEATDRLNSAENYFTNDIYEFLNYLNHTKPRTVDAFSCLKQIGTPEFVVNSFNTPVMKYYVSVTANSPEKAIQFNEPVVKETLKVPLQIYAIKEEYVEETTKRAYNLLQIIKENNPDIWTRLYGFDAGLK